MIIKVLFDESGVDVNPWNLHARTKQHIIKAGLQCMMTNLKNIFFNDETFSDKRRKIHVTHITSSLARPGKTSPTNPNRIFGYGPEKLGFGSNSGWPIWTEFEFGSSLGCPNLGSDRVGSNYLRNLYSHHSFCYKMKFGLGAGYPNLAGLSSDMPNLSWVKFGLTQIWPDLTRLSGHSLALACTQWRRRCLIGCWNFAERLRNEKSNSVKMFLLIL